MDGAHDDGAVGLGLGEDDDAEERVCCGDDERYGARPLAVALDPAAYIMVCQSTVGAKTSADLVMYVCPCD